MTIYQNDKYVTVTYIKNKNYIIFDWVNLTIPLEDIKTMHEKALDFAVKNNCFNYIVETSKPKTSLRQDVLDWFTVEWVPKLIEAKLKAVITILPQSTLATISTKTWQKQVTGGIVLQNAKSLDEAEQILKEL